MSSLSPVLTLRDVHVDRDGHPALRGVDATAFAGRLLAVVGPNGSGKSTLLGVAAGLIAPTRGEVHRREGIRIALVHQTTALPAHLPLTVTDVVAMGTWARLGAWRPARREDRRSVAEAIGTVGLSHAAQRPIGMLSGGQRQRAFLAQTLVQQVELVLLDEPMAGLDTESRAAVASAITHLTDRGVAVIAVTHDRSEFAAIDDTLELYDGLVVA